MISWARLYRFGKLSWPRMSQSLVKKVYKASIFNQAEIIHYSLLLNIWIEDCQEIYYGHWKRGARSPDIDKKLNISGGLDGFSNVM